MKTALALVAALAFSFSLAGTEASAAPSGAMAAQSGPCKDAAGKFMKCPAPAPVVAKVGPCKDAKGKFMKCPDVVAAPPAKAGPCKDAAGKFTKCPASAMAAKKPSAMTAIH
jgi:hypothetical protein